ncbi:Uncharacterised protein [Mycobacterium tuberculosis]|nr:Uncharacterised protein [Mycobacterium tuberculosis]
MEIRIICAGPAQTNTVVATAHPSVKPVSWANAPTPINVPKSTSARIDDSADFTPNANAAKELCHFGESRAGSAKERNTG